MITGIAAILLPYGLFQVSSVTAGSANCGLHFWIRLPTSLCQVFAVTAG